MIAHVAQLTLPHELEQAMSMVTENAAKAARVDDYGIAPRQACRPRGRRRPLRFMKRYGCNRSGATSSRADAKSPVRSCRRSY
jgi:hypothetical protein